MSETHTNNTVEVTGLKEAGIEEETNVAWVQRSDGTRDTTWSISTVQLEEADEAAIQQELLTKLQTKLDTTTYLFIGDTAPSASGDVMDMAFTGKMYIALVASVSTDYPYGSDITGTIEMQNKGTAPVSYDSESFSDIIDILPMTRNN